MTSSIKNIITNELRIENHVFYSSGSEIFVKDITTTNTPFKISSQVSSGTNISSIEEVEDEIKFNYTDGTSTRTRDFHQTFLPKNSGISELKDVYLHDGRNGVVVWENNILQTGSYATVAQQGSNDIVTSDLLFSVSQSFFNINDLNINLANNGAEYDPPVPIWDGKQWIGSVLSIGEMRDVTLPTGNIANDSILYWDVDRFRVKDISTYNYVTNNNLTTQLTNYIKLDGTNTNASNTNKVLIWDSTKWQGSELKLTDIKEVEINSLQNESMLIYRNGKFQNQVVRSIVSSANNSDIVNAEAIRNELSNYLKLTEGQSAQVNDYIKWNGSNWIKETPRNTAIEVVAGSTELVSASGVREYVSSMTATNITSDTGKYALTEDIRNYISTKLDVFKDDNMNIKYTDLRNNERKSTTLLTLLNHVMEQETSEENIIIRSSGTIDDILTNSTMFQSKTLSSFVEDVKQQIGSGILNLVLHGSQLQYDTVDQAGLRVKDQSSNEINIVAYEDTTLISSGTIYYLDYDTTSQRLKPKELTTIDNLLSAVKASSGAFAYLTSEEKLYAKTIDATGDVTISGSSQLNAITVAGNAIFNQDVTIKSTVRVNDEMYIRSLRNDYTRIDASGSGTFVKLHADDLHISSGIEGHNITCSGLQVNGNVNVSSGSLQNATINTANVDTLTVTKKLDIDNLEQFTVGTMSANTITCSGSIQTTQGSLVTMPDISSERIVVNDYDNGTELVKGKIEVGKVETEVLALEISSRNVASLNTGTLTISSGNDYESVYRTIVLVQDDVAVLSTINIEYKPLLGSQISLMYTNESTKDFNINVTTLEIFEMRSGTLEKQTTFVNYGKPIIIPVEQTVLINLLKMKSSAIGEEDTYFVNFVRYNLASEP